MSRLMRRIVLPVVVLGMAGPVLVVTGCGKEKPAQTGAGGQAKVQFVNDRCPIMGSPIDPAKVPPDLVREHRGQKVAFCCDDCPPVWDKLTDAEKDAKLAQVMAPSGAHHEGHEQ